MDKLYFAPMRNADEYLATEQLLSKIGTKRTPLVS